jgi:hypothetical protein
MWYLCSSFLNNFAVIFLTKNNFMKGKYISTSLILAVLSGGKHQPTILVDEVMASTRDHAFIWTKNEKDISVAASGLKEG